MKIKTLFVVILLSSIAALCQGIGGKEGVGGSAGFGGGAVAAAPANIGIDFRGLSTYVSDTDCEVAGRCTYSVPGDTYPTTRNGFTFGVGTCPPGANWLSRSTSTDTRLAGIFATPNNLGTVCTFTILLPAPGTYTIYLALGDSLPAAQGPMSIVLEDNTTVLATLTPTVSSGDMDDATQTSYSLAAWPGSQMPITKTFATTTFNIVIGAASGTASTYSVISHVFVQ